MVGLRTRLLQGGIREGELKRIWRQGLKQKVYRGMGVFTT
jgi:hypothetical protein